MAHNSYDIRPFTTAEAGLYKAMRLEALELEAGMFGSNLAHELAFSDEQWLSRITNPDAGCFGLFHGDELIGITGIVIDNKERPEDAQMTQSYIRKAYRGKGLSRMLYDIRLQWAREHGIKRLLIGHRASNHASKAANQHYGFTYIHSETRTWGDGETMDNLYYELWL
ncbi:MAG: hypothetical protein BGO69_13855 [Bacteroidetes bacterium 46-16]|nr:MAG: hypothetical protein BGO69_13855 [Bacteroidetes bacterium 46-16]